MQPAAEKTSIKKNFIMNTVLTVSSFIFPLLTFPYISRILLAEGSGKVSFAASLVAYFIMFAQLGIPIYGIRATAQVRDDREELSRITHELMIINLIMSFISYGIFLICLSIVPRMQKDKMLMVIDAFSILFCSFEIEWLYKGLEKYTYITIRSVTFKLLSVIAIFMLVHKQEDYIIYALISLLSSCASILINFLNAKKYINMRPVGQYNFSRHFKPIAIFFAMTCAGTIYNSLDSVMLGFMGSDADVGYYNAAVKVKLILTSIVISLGTVLMPRTSYYIQHKKYDLFFTICQKALNFVFIISVPLTVFFMISADHMVLLVAGPAFAQAILPMRVIMPSVFLIGISNILGIQMLVPLGKEKTVFYAEAVGAVVDLLLNIILIPSFRSVGTAIGTLMAETAVTLICFWALRKEVAESFRNINYKKIAISLIAASASLLWMRFFNFGDFVTLAVSSILFFGVYVLFLYIQKEPLTVELADQLFQKIKGLQIG